MRLIDLKNQAWASFRDIENSFQKLLSPIYDQYNISSLQLRVLSYIHTKKSAQLEKLEIISVSQEAIFPISVKSWNLMAI